MSDHEVKEQTVRFKCGRCNKNSEMKVIFTYNEKVENEYEDETGKNYEYLDTYILRLSVCPACDTINYSYEEEGEITVLWPQTTEDKKLSVLPPKVKKAYQAAQKVRSVDSNSYGVLLGRVLDLVCLDRGATGNSLNERIKSLVGKGEIPSRLADMAHQLRQLRNIGAHADLGELSAAENSVLDDLCSAILEYVYFAPMFITQVEERLKKLKTS